MRNAGMNRPIITIAAVGITSADPKTIQMKFITSPLSDQSSFVRLSVLESFFPLLLFCRYRTFLLILGKGVVQCCSLQVLL